MSTNSTPEQLFWSKVNKNGPVPPHKPDLGACWEWTGCKVRGYGHVTINKVAYLCHRVAFKWAGGDPGIVLRHDCDNPGCVRPSHLTPGTQAENRADCVAKNRQAKGETHFTRTRPERVAKGDRSAFKRHPELVKRGAENPASKLTEEDVRKIRHLLSAGLSQRAVAKQFGVHQSCVWLIANRKKWAHLD